MTDHDKTDVTDAAPDADVNAEDWGLSEGSSGMAKETKIGLSLVLVLIAALGVMMYRKMNPPTPDFENVAEKEKGETGDTDSDDEKPIVETKQGDENPPGQNVGQQQFEPDNRYAFADQQPQDTQYGGTRDSDSNWQTGQSQTDQTQSQATGLFEPAETGYQQYTQDDSAEKTQGLFARETDGSEASAFDSSSSTNQYGANQFDGGQSGNTQYGTAQDSTAQADPFDPAASGADTYRSNQGYSETQYGTADQFEPAQTDRATGIFDEPVKESSAGVGQSEPASWDQTDAETSPQQSTDPARNEFGDSSYQSTRSNAYSQGTDKLDELQQFERRETTYGTTSQTSEYGAGSSAQNSQFNNDNSQNNDSRQTDQFSDYNSENSFDSPAQTTGDYNATSNQFEPEQSRSTYGTESNTTGTFDDQFDSANTTTRRSPATSSNTYSTGSSDWSSTNSTQQQNSWQSNSTYSGSNTESTWSSTSTSSGGRQYEIQPGDNYWRISKKVYGTVRYFQALELHNKSRFSDATKLRPGKFVLTPSQDVLESTYPQLFKKSRPTATNTVTSAKPAATSTRKPAGPAGFFRGTQGEPLYRIGKLDTLSGIAQKHLGRSTRWIQIYNLNRGVLSSPDRLSLGAVIRLPADASSVELVNRQPNSRY